MINKALTDNKEFAINFKKNIEEVGLLKYTEFKSEKINEISFVYKNDDVKEEHRKYMIERGWNVVEGVEYAILYNDPWEKEIIKVSCSIFQKNS